MNTYKINERNQEGLNAAHAVCRSLDGKNEVVSDLREPTNYFVRTKQKENVGTLDVTDIESNETVKINVRLDPIYK